MNVHNPNPLEPAGGRETPESVFFSRRKWLRRAGYLLGAGALGVGGWLYWRGRQGSDSEVVARGEPKLDEQSPLAQAFPAPHDGRFEYQRVETARAEAARYTNFYEFSKYKWSWRLVDDFKPFPWTITIDGLCRNPMTLDIEEFHRRYGSELVERQYRHRCVETWAMAVPWTGVPLARLLRDADPLASATHVRFVSFLRPDEAPNQYSGSEYPWPYVEGLTLPEAANDLTLLASGVYGRPLLKQHGAPIRLVVPWKYGYKSIKSVQRIELVDRQPATFWNTVTPRYYPFESNVDPADTIPWPQTTERMLGTDEQHPTQWLNGYQEHVAHLYEA